MSVVGAATFRQVHGQKGNFVEHVDPSQSRVKFDAVENPQPGSCPRNVSEMEVAMALPDPAVTQAGCEQVGQLVEALTTPCFQVGELGVVDRAG